VQSIFGGRVTNPAGTCGDIGLGTVAHQAVLKAFNLKLSSYVFAHNAKHALPVGRTLVDSYHTSRYNVQTKRLTKEMFAEVFRSIGRLLD